MSHRGAPLSSLHMQSLCHSPDPFLTCPLLCGMGCPRSSPQQGPTNPLFPSTASSVFSATSHSSESHSDARSGFIWIGSSFAQPVWLFHSGVPKATSLYLPPSHPRSPRPGRTLTIHRTQPSSKTTLPFTLSRGSARLLICPLETLLVGM